MYKACPTNSPRTEKVMIFSRMMKKASSFLLLPNLFNPQRFSKPASFLSSNCISHNFPLPPSSSSFPSFSSSLHHSTCPHLPSSAKTHGLLFKLHRFQAYPSRNLDTLVGKPTQFSSTSSQKKQREKSCLEEDFGSAQTSEEMLRAFEDMEMAGCFDERELGIAALKLGFKLHQGGEDHEKALSFAERALQSLTQDGKPSISILTSMAFHLMGSVYHSLNRFNESETYFMRADIFLGKNRIKEFKETEETPFHLKKSLEITEIILDKDSKEFGYTELGVGFRGLANTYVSFGYFKEALPFCLKALEIHTKVSDLDPLFVANDRVILGTIYRRMGEYEKALEQFELTYKVFKNMGYLHFMWFPLAIDIVADLQIKLGKYDEAIDTLKGIFQYIEKDSENQAQVYILMGQALFHQENFADSKRYLEIACGILEKKEILSPFELAKAYVEISKLYETMNEFDTAISLLKKTLALLEKLPEEQQFESFVRVSAKLGQLLFHRDRAPEAIFYLEIAADKLKGGFGSDPIDGFNTYFNLAAAYLQFNRRDLAVEMFAVAKDIMDVSFDPHNADSIKACHKLSLVYSAMGSYALAIELQQRVVNAWEGHGPNSQDELREAQRLLDGLKTEAHGPNTSKDRRLRYFAMVQKLCDEKQYAEAKRCLEIGCGILDKNLKKEIVSPIEVAKEYALMSKLYETMNEFGAAISLLKKALALFQKQPQDKLFEGHVFASLGELILLRGDVPQAIPYLERAVERLKESFDSKPLLGFDIYLNLGRAYSKSDRAESAAKMFGVAKNLMDVSLDPHHVDSIERCRRLSEAYSDIGSYNLAIEFQQRYINFLESLGPRAEDVLQEHRSILEELKKKAKAGKRLTAGRE